LIIFTFKQTTAHSAALCSIKNITVKGGLTIQSRNNFETTQKNNKFE